MNIVIVIPFHFLEKHAVILLRSFLLLWKFKLGRRRTLGYHWTPVVATQYIHILYDCRICSNHRYGTTLPSQNKPNNTHNLYPRNGQVSFASFRLHFEIEFVFLLISKNKCNKEEEASREKRQNAWPTCGCGSYIGYGCVYRARQGLCRRRRVA